MEEKSILPGTLDSNLDTRTELICNACKQRLVQMLKRPKCVYDLSLTETSECF